MVRVGEIGFLFYQIFPDSGIGIPSNGTSWITVCSTDAPYVVLPSVFVQVVIINGSLILPFRFCDVNHYILSVFRHNLRTALC